MTLRLLWLLLENIDRESTIKCVYQLAANDQLECEAKPFKHRRIRNQRGSTFKENRGFFYQFAGRGIWLNGSFTFLTEHSTKWWLLNGTILLSQIINTLSPCDVWAPMIFSHVMLDLLGSNKSSSWLSKVYVSPFFFQPRVVYRRGFNSW